MEDEKTEKEPMAAPVPVKMPEPFDSGRSHKWLKALGTGQFGVVVIANNLKTHEKCALKLIPTDNHQILLNKLKVCQTFCHKNVVDCHDLWSSRLNPRQMKELKTLFPSFSQNLELPPLDPTRPLVLVNLELRLCEESLRHYLKTTEDTLSRRFEIIKEITCGLEYIHSQNMTHGNLKPENILIYRNPNQGINCFKISDPGLALLIPPRNSSNSWSESTRYEAPEQIGLDLATPNCTQATDIFALGLIWFELMHLKCNQNGHQNYEEGNDSQFWDLLDQLLINLKDKRIFPQDFISDQFLSKLILDMTDKDLIKRPALALVVEIFDSSLRRNVESWTRHHDELEKSFEIGDVIEINHAPCSHWTIYYGNGHVIHFKTLADHGKESAANSEEFHRAQITVSPLKDIAGVCLIRLNNRPDIRIRVRQLKSTLELIKNLLNQPRSLYSLAYFNSEHLITYLKFVGVSFSTQVMENRKLFYKIKMHEKKNPQDIQTFNKFAFQQWVENLKYMDGIRPDYRLLERRVREWGN